ncbi:Sec-independent protein translocase protein TatB [Asticcacaulis tiandongensis]|uniref:Sec-independent protein translocase protein TatB n=1 Tax=Asticcacaulis tiandongensis TaxID=2565365 RepID=UPI00112B1C8A
MLPGIGGSELILIAIVALIVVGPKDLPKLMRQIGRFVAKMRSMADEFRTSFEDMARQSELDDLRKEVEALRSGQSVSPVLDDIREDMRKIETEIDQNIKPVGPSYSAAKDVPSPDEEDLGRPAVIDDDPMLDKPILSPKAAALQAQSEAQSEAGAPAKPKRAPRKKAVAADAPPAKAAAKKATPKKASPKKTTGAKVTND